MPDDLSSLSADDVQQLIQIIESLENSAFDFLQLEVGGMKVSLGKGTPPGPQAAAAPVQPPSMAPAAPIAPVTPAVATPVAPIVGSSPQLPVAHVEDGTVAVTAPIMGLFYAKPDPSSAPFVTVGSTVDNDTTVCLVEVMKMFNAVPAGVSGTVVEVLATDTELVEYGQPLFRVRPH